MAESKIPAYFCYKGVAKENKDIQSIAKMYNLVGVEKDIPTRSDPVKFWKEDDL